MKFFAILALALIAVPAQGQVGNFPDSGIIVSSTIVQNNTTRAKSACD